MNWIKVSRIARPASHSAVVSGYALVLLTGFCISTMPAMAADCVVPSISTGAVTLRAAPVATSAAVGTLRAGANLPLVASLPGWYKTVLDGQTAFAAKRSTTLSPCLSVPPPVPGDRTFELHAIDVGTGLSVLIRGADFTVLYDAGSNDDLARGDNNRTIAYLKTLQPPLGK